MRLRQAKKIIGWCKGDGDYYTINHHKDHRKSFCRKCEHLRPMYFDRERGVLVQPSFQDIDIIRRANTRLFRWIRKGEKLNNYKYEEKKLMFQKLVGYLTIVYHVSSITQMELVVILEVSCSV